MTTTLKREQLLELIKESCGAMVQEQIQTAQAQWMERALAPFEALAQRTMTVQQPVPEKGIRAARVLRVLAGAKGDPMRAAAAYIKWYGEDNVSKALAASDATAGGFLLQEDIASEVIEYLRPMSVVQKMNPVVVPLDSGTMRMPKVTGGASAGYIAENNNISMTGQTFGQVQLTAKKLAAFVPISNDLIRRASMSADAVVRDDLSAALAQRGDLAFIRGDGTAGSPKGLRYWAPSANVLTMTSTVSLAHTTTDLGLLMLALMNNNVRMLRPGWLFAPRTYVYLTTVRDGNGNFAFRDEMMGGRLWGYPFGVTTQIPINLAVTSTAETEVYFADFADVVIGEATTLLVDASTEAGYYDGSSQQSAFTLDQTVIRAIQEHDMAVRHAESIAVIKDCSWT
jgi:HK97 family phage major capsid protein